MRPIRIYLLLCYNQVEWVSSIHRDLDEVLVAWEAGRKVAATVGIVHVGTSRPPNSAFSNVASCVSDCIVLTTSARWAFDRVGTYSDAIEYVEGLGLHVALSGWGHAEQNLLDIAGAHQSSRDENAKVFGSPWLNLFSEINPKMARDAWSLGVQDDASYCSQEQSFHWDMRHALGTARMNYLMTTRDTDNPIHVATSCPPWLLDTPLDLINATVRCTNALRSASIKLVADLLQLTTDDLLSISNFGRKSLNDLAIALRSASQNGPILQNTHDDTCRTADHASGVAKVVIENKGHFQDEYIDKPPSRRSFKLAFEFNMSCLKVNQRIVLRRRIGSDGPKMTLAEIGEEIGISRERVRQIESDIIEIFRMDGVWQTELAARLDAILKDREDPLPAESLHIFDLWFADVENMMPELDFIFGRILDDQFSVLEINGWRFVTRISRIEWQNVVREGRMVLERAAQNKLSKAYARQLVEELLSNKGGELVSELWASLQTTALFARDERGVEVVVGVGTNSEDLVSAVLSASDRPLHFTEIPKRIQDAFGQSVEVKRAHSAARNVGMLFGRGTFGTLRHCPLTLEEMNILRHETEEIIFAGAKDRQWSCFELVERLAERDLEFGDVVNTYIVHLALQMSSVLSNLGRFVWTQSGERPYGTQDRIDIAQAILSVLQSGGRPMTRVEIRTALMRDRGLSGSFQIHPRGSLVRTSPSYWGILERDILLSQTEIRKACACAAGLLESDQRGIHLTEIKKRLSDGISEILFVDDPVGIFSVLLTDSRFRSSLSGYIYLESWGTPRRLSQGDAVMAVLRQVKDNGIQVSELLKKAAELLGWTIQRESVYNNLVTCGAEFNDETGRWTLDDDESEAEIDEDALGTANHAILPQP